MAKIMLATEKFWKIPWAQRQGQKVGAGKLTLPKMVKVPGTNFQVMQTPVTLGLFRAVMGGHHFCGHEADSQKKIVKSPVPKEAVLDLMSFWDGHRLAKRLSAITGRNFAVPSEEEWLKVEKSVEEKLFWPGNFEWNRTRSEICENNEVRMGRGLRTPLHNFVWHDYPSSRKSDSTNYLVRLIEYLPEVA